MVPTKSTSAMMTNVPPSTKELTDVGFVYIEKRLNPITAANSKNKSQIMVDCLKFSLKEWKKSLDMLLSLPRNSFRQQ